MTVKHKCSRKVYGIVPCSRPATVQRDGKWWCWQHDPEYIARKAAERRAKRQARKDLVTTNWKRNARNAKLAALMTLELPALLERLAQDSEAWAQDNNDYSEEAVQARALAARIREVLALEADDAKSS